MIHCPSGDQRGSHLLVALQMTTASCGRPIRTFISVAVFARELLRNASHAPSGDHVGQYPSQILSGGPPATGETQMAPLEV